MDEKSNMLKQIRKDRGFTIKEVVNGTGIPMRTYQNYEYQAREIGAGALQKLADFYGVTTDYLLGREPKSPEPNPFADLNLSEDDEAEVVAKYMSMPPEVRAIMLDVLLQLADAARNKPNENEKRSEHQ